MQQNWVKCFEKIEISDYDKIQFISYNEDDEYSKTIFRCGFRRNDLNYLYQKQDYLEAAYRTFDEIGCFSDEYQFHALKVKGDSITDEGHSHYVQFQFKEPIEVCVSEKKTDEFICLLFDAENGDFWLGDINEVYYLHAELSKQEEIFQIDSGLLEIIEGKWPQPQYDNFIEEMMDKLV